MKVEVWYSNAKYKGQFMQGYGHMRHVEQELLPSAPDKLYKTHECQGTFEGESVESVMLNLLSQSEIRHPQVGDIFLVDGIMYMKDVYQLREL